MSERERKFIKNTRGCHICVSHGKNSEKYINTSREGKKIGMHRLVFFETHGYLPQVVMHSCDNPKCINPKHLVAGTFKKNSEDMVKKKRQAYGINNGGGTKLNDRKAKKIKELLKEGKLSLEKIGRRFGVSKRTILFIKQNKHWRHV